MDEEIQEPILLKIAESHGNLERLDRFLASELPEYSRSRIQNWIRQGQIQVNNAPAKARAQLQAGDEIVIEIPPETAENPQPEAIPLEILFEDDHLLVLNKGEGMVVHPGAGVTTGTLVHALLAYCQGKLSTLGGMERQGIVHRLDKDTSGCLVAAKDDATHQALTEAFAAREVRKAYLCFVDGLVRDDRGTQQNYIGRNPGNRQKMAIVDERIGKFAHTDFEVLGRGADYSAVRCDLHTGRTHQIRVHMAYGLGHPILGDVIYGKRTLKHAGATRLMLHAWKLAFSHPHTGELLEFEAPLQPEFAKLLDDCQR